MASITFEGHLAGMSDIQLEFVKSVLEKLGYKNNNVLIEPVGKIGDNYVALVNRFTVVGNNGETFKIVAKAAPNIEIIRKNMNTEILFRNEHTMYTKVLPRLVDLQKAAGVNKENCFRYPICYGSFNEAPNEIIILEDLMLSDFVMLDRLKFLTDDNIRLVLKEMAVLHSLSYALKKDDIETFNNFKDELINFWVHMENLEDVAIYFDDLEKDVLSIVDGNKYKEVITGTVSEITKLGKKQHQYDIGSRYAVIQHGDSWTNNIMFKIQEGKSTDCLLIDYQVSKISNPVADLFYFIFNCTDYATRHKYFYDWIDFYHTELDKSLSNFGLKANFIYPRDQLDVDMRRHGKYALAMLIILASATVRESADIIDFKTEEIGLDEIQQKMQERRISLLPKATVTKFRSKVEGAVDSLKEFGFL